MVESPDGTVCPRCAVGCRLARNDADPDRAVGRPGPANPDGHLCARGARAPASLDDADRLTAPRVREDGDLVPVDWETALDRAAAALDGVRNGLGSDALAFLGAPHCTNEANYRLQKLARLLGTNNVDNRARGCHAAAADALSSRLGHPATTLAVEDVGRADLVVVAGANPAVQQPVFFDAFVRPAVADGTTLVHVDPGTNETTRLADRHVAPRPGTDARLFLGVCADLVARGAVDRAFVDARTSGFEAYADGLSAFDPATVAADAGVPPDAVTALADDVAAADRVAVLAATGVEADDGATPAALLDLLCLTGNVGIRGAGFVLLRGLANEQGAVDVGCRPDALPGHAALDDGPTRARLLAAWGTPPPTAPGRTWAQALDAFGEEVRGALVVGENPAVSKRDAAWVDDRLRALDALVVVDVRESETVRRADVALPAAAGLEKRGTVTAFDRRVQSLSPVADPPEGVRTDHAILGALGRRLVGAQFDGDIAATARELAAVSPLHRDVDPGDRWPADADGRALYAESFDTPDGTAPFAAPSPPPADVPGGSFALVVRGRAGGPDRERGDGRVRVNPADAATLDLRDGDQVTVRAVDGTATVDVAAAVTESVREGGVALHAADADALVRAGTGAVHVVAR